MAKFSKPTILHSTEIVSIFPAGMMVDFKAKDPVVISRKLLALAKLWHTVNGLYIWEFFTTLYYEWSVIRGNRPYRWTIWLYSLTRVATLVVVIISMTGVDTSMPINCQLWATFGLSFAYTAIATASLLIVLRVIAIWNRNRIVYAIAMGGWVASVSCLVLGLVRLRGAWSPITNSCVVTNATASGLSAIVTSSTDIVLLLITLVRLYRWRLDAGGSSPLCCFLWKQGLIWLFLGTIGYTLPTVFILLNFEAPFNMMFSSPALITSSVAATRMYRSLTDFGSRNVSISTPKLSNRPIRFKGMKDFVQKDNENGLAPQASRICSCATMDGPSSDNIQGLGDKDDV